MSLPFVLKQRLPSLDINEPLLGTFKLLLFIIIVVVVDDDVVTTLCIDVCLHVCMCTMCLQDQ